MMQILVGREFQFLAMEKNRIADFQAHGDGIFLFDEAHQIAEEHKTSFLELSEII